MSAITKFSFSLVNAADSQEVDFLMDLICDHDSLTDSEKTVLVLAANSLRKMHEQNESARLRMPNFPI